MQRLAKKGRRAFTLVEIMIVVLIIGILLAIAIPNFVKARNSSRAKACMSNLKQIDGAIEQYMMEKRTTEYPFSLFDLLEGGQLKTYPRCPSGGSYSIFAAEFLGGPRCTIRDNETAAPDDDHVLIAD